MCHSWSKRIMKMQKKKKYWISWFWVCSHRHLEKEYSIFLPDEMCFASFTLQKCSVHALNHWHHSYIDSKPNVGCVYFMRMYIYIYISVCCAYEPKPAHFNSSLIYLNGTANAMTIAVSMAIYKCVCVY